MPYKDKEKRREEFFKRQPQKQGNKWFRGRRKGTGCTRDNQRRHHEPQ